MTCFVTLPNLVHEMRVITIRCHVILYYVGYNNESTVEIKRNAKEILNVNKIYANFFFLNRKVFTSFYFNFLWILVQCTFVEHEFENFAVTRVNGKKKLLL